MNEAGEGGRGRAGARGYAMGLAFVAVAGVAIGIVLPPPARAGWWPALVLGLVVQAPLGWWVISSLGRPGFLVAWGAGLLARFGLVGLAAFLLVPQLGWPPSATLLSLVGVLVALMLVEMVVVHSMSSAQRPGSGA